MSGSAHKDKVSVKIIAIVIATAGVLCFPQVMNLKENELGFTNSIFSVLIWILCIHIIIMQSYGLKSD